MTENIRTKESSGIVTLTFDSVGSEVNTLSRDVVLQLEKIVSDLSDKTSLRGVLICSAKPGCFIAGADIKDIETFQSPAEATEGSRFLSQTLSRLAQLPVPSVALIEGTCLGGGLELALACQYRVVADSEKVKLGLPEIQLGLIPGAGGTQRLPKIVGLTAALDMILTGKQIRAQQALRMGLVDACVPASEMAAFATRLFPKPASVLPVRPKTFAQKAQKTLLEGNPLGRAFVRAKVLKTVQSTTKGFYPAPFRAIDCIFKSFSRSPAEGFAAESAAFGELACTKESASLVHLFHCTTAAKKSPHAGQAEAVVGISRPELVGVIGAGFMGAGIATVCADKGIRVRLSDPNKDTVGRAMAHIAKFLHKRVKRKRMKPFEAESRLARVSPGLAPSGFKLCDIVIEAVFENLELKKKLVAQAEAWGNARQVFATNTSAIQIGRIGADAKHPERIVGMHFFSPVEKMPLLEIIETDKTAPWVVDMAFSLGKDMGKQIIVVKDSPGFYTTRALAFFLAEAIAVVQEGAGIEDVDRALCEFGFPVGPIALIDEVGIDVGVHVLATMRDAFSERIVVPESLQAILAKGYAGRKNGRGFYRYRDDRRGLPDEQILSMLRSGKRSGALPQAQDIVDRCVLAFVNEAVRCLDEGVLRSATDGDLGAVFGLGFPPFLGGPFWYAEKTGIAVILEKLKNLAGRMGNRFTPANGLIRAAENNGTFFSGK